MPLSPVWSATDKIIPYSWKFSRDLYFKNFVVKTKFVKYKTLKYLKSITQILDIAKIRKNYFLEIGNKSKFVKYRALKNNQLYGNVPSRDLIWGKASMKRIELKVECQC